MKKLKIISKKNEIPFGLDYFKKVDLNDLGYDELIEINDSYQKLGNKFYSSPEYKLIYPYLAQVYKLIKIKIKESSEKVMKEMGVWYGDIVHYDYVGPFMTVEEYSGVIQKGDRGNPVVKLTSGKTIGGKKIVNWHKGWKK